MNIVEAVKERHSVRSYIEQEIPENIISQLQQEIADCNEKGGMHLQLIINEPEAFGGPEARCENFTGVKNYIALIGKCSEDLDIKAGYYGEHLVLFVQTLGLNTCWVAETFSKEKVEQICQVECDEKLVCVLSLGYGKTQGRAHRSKEMGQLCHAEGEMPEWFKEGMESAILAPTANNQQRFFITMDGRSVSAEVPEGEYSKIDLGIVKYHFELGAGTEHFIWK